MNINPSYVNLTKLQSTRSNLNPNALYQRSYSNLSPYKPLSIIGNDDVKQVDNSKSVKSTARPRSKSIEGKSKTETLTEPSIKKAESKPKVSIEPSEKTSLTKTKTLTKITFPQSPKLLIVPSNNTITSSKFQIPPSESLSES